MEKTLKYLLLTCFVILTSMASTLVVLHYKADLGHPGEDQENIETVVYDDCQTTVEKMNPVMGSLVEVFELQALIKDEYQCDSIMRIIDPDVLTSITNVLLGRNGTINKYDIITEYRNNYETVYRYIKNVPPGTKKQVDSIVQGDHIGAKTTTAKTIPKNDSTLNN